MSGVKNIIINGNLAAVDVSDDFLKDFFDVKDINQIQDADINDYAMSGLIDVLQDTLTEEGIEADLELE